jgi:hypothetical protein
MGKRLFMTSADYLAIAISPALIMALVGSLVFFLIEVFYAGQYQARLNYAFALFVFAAVLIARISIEMGSERAVLFALPLGLVMFLFMQRFVEHPSAWSHLINVMLLVVVWWCAHQLTWDSTVINDDEDASGEGLMQRLGVDGPANAEGATQNELFDKAGGEEATTTRWWQRWKLMGSGPHTPGTWVLYFSLAALPLFGVGQYWIPASDAGRRRYVFGLLIVYVAAALSLLVTTSFLNLRRYLRQRRVEMPLPIAGTWVGVGAVLILLVMLLAALVPRPNAEIALSRVPWQAGTPGDHTASRTSVLRDAGEKQGGQQDAKVGETVGEEGQQVGEQTSEQAKGEGKPSESRDGSRTMEGQGSSQSEQNQTGEGQQADTASDKAEGEQQRPDGSQTGEQSGEDDTSESSSAADESPSGQNEQAAVDQNDAERTAEQSEEAKDQPAASQPTPPQSPLQQLVPRVGGLAGLLKILFYAIAALAIAFLVWRYRHQLLQALADILRQLRELFGGKRVSGADDEEAGATAAASLPSFTEFRDPFQTGQHGRLSPEELVRYTFAAFEAWSSDRGSPRTLDCTPQELVNLAVDPKTPMHTEARRLIQLYGQVAYASQRVPREAANELSQFWQMMRAAYFAQRAESAPR